MKNFYIWRRKPLKDCNLQSLVACIKFCWGTLPTKKRYWARKRLIKIANCLAKDKHKRMWEI